MLALGLLLADCLCPDSEALWLGYILVVVLSAPGSMQRVLVSAAGSSVFLMIGAIVGPAPAPAWLDSTLERGPILGAIWVTALLVGRVSASSAEKELLQIEVARLKRAEIRFRLLLESSPNAMILVNGKGTIVDANALAASAFGYSRAELEGSPVERLVPPRCVTRHVAKRASFLRTPDPRAMGVGRELSAVRKDGSEFPVEIGLNLIEHEEEDALVLASVVDISERKRAAEDFRAIVEASPGAILVADSDGSIVLVNSRLNELFGYQHDELLGRSSDILIPSTFPGDAEQRRRFFLSPKPTFLGEGHKLFGLHKDGTQFPFEISLNPIETSRGRRVLASIVDLSERVHVEAVLRSAALELRRSNKELDSFADVASHDLKAPLRAIDSLAGWIDQDAGSLLPAESRAHLSTLRQRVRRMEKLLNDLLQYSRAGSGDESTEVIDCGELVQAVTEVLACPAGISIRILGEMPCIRCARPPLELVLRNLLDNAIKHHDRPQGTIEVSAKLCGDRAEFFVADDGPGIPSAAHQHIFGMFHTLQPRNGGSGMGLAVVKKVVERNGGTIRIENRRERGARFVFTWVCSPVPVEAA